MPLELFTFLGSAILGAIKTFMMMKMKNNANLAEAQLLAMNARAKINKDLRQHGDKGFKLTRRIIALTVIFAVVLLPLMAPYFSMYSYLFSDFPFPSIPVTFGYTELQPGLWPFTSDVDLIKWYESDNGFTITPFHTHMSMAIVGFFFGEHSKA